MSRTAAMIVLFVAALLTAPPANGAPPAGQDGCCPCPSADEGAASEALAANMEHAPETVELDMNGEFYGPMEFTHLEHTDYADEGCTQCHHHQPPLERFKKCGACHESKPFQGPDKLNVPGLKGAYHRQCVGCHVDYGSGPTECTECHEPKSKDAGNRVPDDDE